VRTETAPTDWIVSLKRDGAVRFARFDQSWAISSFNDAPRSFKILRPATGERQSEAPMAQWLGHHARALAIMKDTSEPGSDWADAHMVSLVSTKVFKVAEFRCPGAPEVTEVEAAPFPEIVLPRIGSYLRSDAAGEVLLNKTTLAFFEAGQPYTIRHFRKTPDLTTVIAITDAQSLHAALGVQLPEGRTFSRSAIRMPPEIVLAHKHLLRQIRAGADGLFAAEEIGAEIILRSLALNLEDQQELARRRPPSSVSDPFALAEAVVAYVANAFAGRVTLEQVASAVGLSPFHLCRVFQTATGGTIHQHLLSVRLEAAAAQLLETNKSITEIAHDVGFSSHSHLTALFTRTFGAPPSRVRASRAMPQHK
jgi:AraC family transcriptional regulator